MVKKVFDRRRLCTEADLFVTRKCGKTELGAAMTFAQFMVIGESNEQCSIVANDANQAIKIAYKALKSFAYQVDPTSTNKLGGKLLKVGASSMAFREGLQRTASITAFAAGGKPRDGFNSGWVLNDEAGQGKYVNGHNDMESTVQELVGSGGVRRERLRLNTTTAGKVEKGPHRDHIERLEMQLLDEMQIPLGTAKQLPYDNNNAILLRLDPWDWTGNFEDINDVHFFKRVNRAIGITVQPTWYKERIQKALTGTEDDRKEVATKDFNIWQSERVTPWLTAEDIRPLQIDMRIDDCFEANGWYIFVGMDFSMGNDLHAVSYLAWRINPDTEEEEFFADMDAWVTEEGLEDTPYKKLYEQWIEKGWLHLSPGKTLEPTLPVRRIAELYDNGVSRFMGFGYDSYQANIPINALKLWIAEVEEDTKAPKDYVLPISQTYASYNPVVGELDWMVKNNPPLIRFSNNPMWSWEFANVRLDEDVRYNNKKPIKAGAYEKVDNVQCLLSALMMYDRADGRENTE